MPAALWVVPAAQVVHAVQLAAFVVELKVLGPHAAQVRLTVVLPADETNSPAVHVVCAAQTVDGFASWSHVPAAQGTDGARLPAQ